LRFREAKGYPTNIRNNLGATVVAATLIAAGLAAGPASAAREPGLNGPYAAVRPARTFRERRGDYGLSVFGEGERAETHPLELSSQTHRCDCN
jgi:hypothetical protein